MIVDRHWSGNQFLTLSCKTLGFLQLLAFSFSHRKIGSLDWVGL